jgi:hypothetical protein
VNILEMHTIKCRYLLPEMATDYIGSENCFCGDNNYRNKRRDLTFQSVKLGVGGGENFTCRYKV